MIKQNVLDVLNLCKSYGNHLVLDDISFSIRENEIVGFIGPNGAGKSTLFLHFNGIIEPTSGSVEIDGETLKYDKKSLLAARQKVGIVIQNPEDHLFSPTVL